MKPIVILIGMICYTISTLAQVNYYITTKSFDENGYSYQCDVPFSGMVTLYNKNNQWIYVYQVYKSSGESFTMDDDCPDVIEYDTWVDPKCESIVNNAFSAAEKRRVKGHGFHIGMYINSNTGKVDEIDFTFVNFGPFATIPISVYRKIEMEIKQNIWFVPTAEGKKLNYILYWTEAEPQ